MREVGEGDSGWECSLHQGLFRPRGPLAANSQPPARSLPYPDPPAAKPLGHSGYRPALRGQKSIRESSIHSSIGTGRARPREAPLHRFLAERVAPSMSLRKAVVRKIVSQLRQTIFLRCALQFALEPE